MASTFDLSVIFRAIDKLSVPMARMQKKLDIFSAKAQKLGENLSNVGRKMTTFVTLPILGLGTAMVRTAGKFEQYQASFEVLLGSAEKGKKLFDDITELSARTPFQLENLSESARMMLNFGIATEDILPNLQMLGDVAGADSNKLRMLTLAFSQMQSAGRLMGQDLLQMINAGFNPLQIISEQTGKSMAELKEEMSKGAISSEMVAEAFKIATSEGGRFFKNMEKQSKTFFGKWSTMMDKLKIMLKKFGDILLPIFTRIIEKLTELAEWFGNLNPKIKKIILVVLALIAVIGPLIFVIGKLIIVVSMVGKVFKLLSLLASPVGLVILAIIAAIVAIILIIIHWKKIVKLFTKVWKAIVIWWKKTPRIFKILLAAIFPIIGITILVIQHWRKLLKFFVWLFTKLWEIFNTYVLRIIKKILWPFIDVTQMIIDNWDKISEFFINLWKGIVNSFVKAIQTIKDIWRGFTEWAMKNPVLKWLFEGDPIDDVKEKKDEVKEEEKKLEKEEEEKEKKKKKNLLNMENMFKKFKGGMADKNTVFVNVKVTAEEGAMATIDQVKSTGKMKKKVASDSKYTGRSH